MLLPIFMSYFEAVVPCNVLTIFPLREVLCTLHPSSGSGHAEKVEDWPAEVEHHACSRQQDWQDWAEPVEGGQKWGDDTHIGDAELWRQLHGQKVGKPADWRDREEEGHI